MKESLNNGKAQVKTTGTDFEIIIPSKKKIFIIVFMIAWLGGWAFGEVTTAASLFTSGFDSGFMAFWLIGWTIGGGFVIFVIVWMLFGKEVIYTNGLNLIIKKKVLGFAKKKEYELRNIRDIRMAENRNYSIFDTRRSMEMYGFGGGTIEFDYGMKTIRFANSIDQAEANYLISSIIKPAIRQ